jgi:hypothetical protein
VGYANVPVTIAGSIIVAGVGAVVFSVAGTANAALSKKR